MWRWIEKLLRVEPWEPVAHQRPWVKLRYAWLCHDCGAVYEGVAHGNCCHCHGARVVPLHEVLRRKDEKIKTLHGVVRLLDRQRRLGRAAVPAIPAIPV